MAPKGAAAHSLGTTALCGCYIGRLCALVIQVALNAVFDFMCEF